MRYAIFLFIVAAALSAMFFGLARHRPVQSVAVSQWTTQGNSDGRSSVNASWSESSFKPNVHPSRRQAIAALAREVARTISALPEVTSPSPRIDVQCDDEALALDTVAALQHIGNLQPSTQPSDGAIELSVEPGDAAVYVRDKSVPQQIHAVLCTGSNKIPLETAFVDKPWVADWTAYVNANSAQHFVTASSPVGSATEQEAFNLACAAAAKQLVNPVTKHIRTVNNGKNRVTITLKDETSQKQIEEAVQSGVAVRDRFVQRFDQSYAQLWQCTLLVDTSPARLEELSTRVRQAQKATIKTAVTSVGSVGVLSVVIVLLYLFADAATKGYFTGRLRAAAFLTLIGGILAIFTFF